MNRLKPFKENFKINVTKPGKNLTFIKDHNISTNIENIVEIALYLTFHNESYLDDSSTTNATMW